MGSHRRLDQQRGNHLLRSARRGGTGVSSASHRHQPHRRGGGHPARPSGVPTSRAGAFINIGSVLSQVGQTFVPAYVISKFGLRGLSEAVRADVADMPGIQVSTVLPYAVDTPHFQDAANATGKQARAMQPVQEPERVARAIVDIARRPRRQRYVPGYVVAGLALHWLWPRATERLLRRALSTFHLVGRQPYTQGNLFSPVASVGAIHGDRRPVVGKTVFALWAARELAIMAAQWLHGTLAWPTPRATR